MRILLVEDEAPLRETLAARLKREGFAVDAAGDGEEGLYNGREVPFDLAIIDLGLPKMSGMDLVKALRAEGKKFPILILTARSSWQDKVEGLKSGADDYLVKPFDLDELLARVRALLRRAAGRADPVLAHGRLRLDPARRQAWCDEAPLALSAREFALLHALLERPGAVLSRGQLEERLYGWNDRLGSNAVEVHVHHLRRKLGDSAIRTVRGVGYAIGE